MVVIVAIVKDEKSRQDWRAEDVKLEASRPRGLGVELRTLSPRLPSFGRPCRATSRASEAYPSKLHLKPLSRRNDYFYLITEPSIKRAKSTPFFFPHRAIHPSALLHFRLFPLFFCPCASLANDNLFVQLSKLQQC